jgi:hypothetical protein
LLSLPYSYCSCLRSSWRRRVLARSRKVPPFPNIGDSMPEPFSSLASGDARDRSPQLG